MVTGERAKRVILFQGCKNFRWCGYASYWRASEASVTLSGVLFFESTLCAWKPHTPRARARARSSQHMGENTKVGVQIRAGAVYVYILHSIKGTYRIAPLGRIIFRYSTSIFQPWYWTCS